MRKNQRSAFPAPIVAAICCDAYHSDKAKGLLRFQCKVSDRFVGLSADNALKSDDSRPAGADKGGRSVPLSTVPAALRFITHAYNQLQRSEAIRAARDQCRRDLRIVAPQVDHRTFATVCRRFRLLAREERGPPEDHPCWAPPLAIHETPRVPASCFTILIAV
jgi:hypothetical protein